MARMAMKHGNVNKIELIDAPSKRGGGAIFNAMPTVAANRTQWNDGQGHLGWYWADDAESIACGMDGDWRR